MITVSVNYLLKPQTAEGLKQETTVSAVARKVVAPALDVLIVFTALAAFQLTASTQTPIIAFTAYAIAMSEFGFLLHTCF